MSQFENPTWNGTPLDQNAKNVCQERIKAMYGCLRAWTLMPSWAKQEGQGGCGEIGVAVRASAFAAVRFWINFFKLKATNDRMDPNLYIQDPKYWDLQQSGNHPEDFLYSHFGMSPLNIPDTATKQALAFTWWWASKAFAHPTRLYLTLGNPFPADRQLGISTSFLISELDLRGCPKWSDPEKQCNGRRCILY